MRSDPESVIEGLYAAWRLQDVEAVLAYCTDDVCFRVLPTGSAQSRIFEMRGRDAFRIHLERLRASWEFLAIHPGPLIVNGDQFREVMRVRARHRATGRILESHKRHVWQFEGRHVKSCDEYEDTALLSAFLRLAECV